MSFDISEGFEQFFISICWRIIPIMLALLSANILAHGGN